MSNKPTHHLTLVTGEGDKAVFTRISPLWATDKGNLTGTIPAGVTITGRVVIVAAKAEDDDNGGAR
jgi:hypothetical protein